MRAFSAGLTFKKNISGSDIEKYDPGVRFLLEEDLSSFSIAPHAECIHIAVTVDIGKG